MAASIHALIQVLALNTYSSKPATLGKMDVVNTLKFLPFSACIQTDTTFVGLKGDLNALEWWTKSCRQNLSNKVNCTPLGQLALQLVNETHGLVKVINQESPNAGLQFLRH